jgi:hypothetical protein
LSLSLSLVADGALITITINDGGRYVALMLMAPVAKADG